MKVASKEEEVRLQKIKLEEINSLKTTSDSEINELRTKTNGNAVRDG